MNPQDPSLMLRLVEYHKQMELYLNRLYEDTQTNWN